MRNATSYINALLYQTKIFTGIVEYIEVYNSHTPKYLSFENPKENSIEVNIGSKKFTILSDIKSNGDIRFNVFLWEFNPSSITRYVGKNIDELSFKRNSDYLSFYAEKSAYKNERTNNILKLDNDFDFRDFGFLFEVFEIFIDNMGEQWCAN